MEIDYNIDLGRTQTYRKILEGMEKKRGKKAKAHVKNSRPSKRSNALTHRKTYAKVRLRSS